MGGKSESTTSNETSTQNLALDRVDGFAVAGNESATINVTDGGAFDVANNALDGAGMVVGSLFDFLKSREEVSAASLNTAQAAVDQLGKVKAPEGTAAVEGMTKAAMWAAIAYAAATVVGKK